MKVSDVMIQDVGTVSSGETLQTAAQLMADLDLDALPVTGDGGIAGILTGRDIILRAVANGLDPRRTRVEEVMSARPVSCRPDDSLDEVHHQMELRRIHRMPVVDADGRLVGMVSHGALSRLPRA